MISNKFLGTREPIIWIGSRLGFVLARCFVRCVVGVNGGLSRYIFILSNW